VPTRFERIDAMPLLPGGKVDRRALLSRVVRRESGGEGHGLDTIWARVLDIAAVPADADFFNLGGDSLRLLDMLLAVEARFGVAIDPAAFVERPTLRHLAGLIGIAPPDAPHAPPIVVAGVAFRLVRRAAGTTEGIALAMPAFRGRAVPEPFIEAGLFARFDIWAADLVAVRGTLLARGQWRDAARRIAAAVRSGAIPRPAILFGYSIAGAVGWRVDRLLAGSPVRPDGVVGFDMPALHRRLRYGGWRRRPGTPGRALHVRRWHPGGGAGGWRPSDGIVDDVTLGTVDHADLVKRSTIASVAAIVDRFAAGAAIGERRHEPPVPTIGGRLARLFREGGATDTALLAELAEMVRRDGAETLWPVIRFVLLAHGDAGDVATLLARAAVRKARSATARYALARIRRAGGSGAAADSVAAPPALFETFAAVDRAIACRPGATRAGRWRDRSRALAGVVAPVAIEAARRLGSAASDARQQRRRQRSDPHREQAQRHRGEDVEPRAQRLPGIEQRQRLQAEGRKGGEAAAQPDEHEQPHVGGHRQPPMRLRQRREGADRERSEDVDDERAPREAVPHPLRDREVERVACDGAESAA
jgi:acyl carrier protein